MKSLSGFMNVRLLGITVAAILIDGVLVAHFQR